MGRKGFVSGFVADTVSLDGYSFVAEEARVEGQAVVVASQIQGTSVVYGSARVDHSNLSGDVRVYGNADLADSELSGYTRVYGNAVLRVIRVYDKSCVFGAACLDGALTDEFIIELHGDCKFGGTANFVGLDTVEDFVEKYGSDRISLIGGSSSWRKRIVLTDVWDMG